MGCSYISSTIRFKGRLVRVSVCFRGQGHLNSARVELGKPLCLREGSKNWLKLTKLIRHDKQVLADVQKVESQFQ
jgi:hypothetical protein